MLYLFGAYLDDPRTLLGGVCVHHFQNIVIDAVVLII